MFCNHCASEHSMSAGFPILGSIFWASFPVMGSPFSVFFIQTPSDFFDLIKNSKEVVICIYPFNFDLMLNVKCFDIMLNVLI